MSNGDFENVIGLIQVYIRSRADENPLTREILVECVDQILNLNTGWRDSVDRERLIRELETRFSVWIGREISLVDEENHIQWLQTNKSNILWRYSNRYRLLLGSRWPQGSIDVLDEITDRILGLLENPQRLGPWDRRGLVVGHVNREKPPIIPV